MTVCLDGRTPCDRSTEMSGRAYLEKLRRRGYRDQDPALSVLQVARSAARRSQGDGLETRR